MGESKSQRGKDMHSLFLCNGDGMVLYKRYYAEVQSEAQWEQTLYRLTNSKWPHARNEVHQCVIHEDKFIVFTFWGDVLVILVGVGDMEELALSDLMDLLSEYVRDNIAKKPLQELTEQILIQSDQYDKLCIGIDEIISATGML